ncbi:MAG: type VI secretion system domain-containing protein [Nannocystis sp.]|nr:type VI secretion system domain-containing protein [Nannocystis sp.]
MSESLRSPIPPIAALCAPAGAPPIADDERYHRLRAAIEAHSALSPIPIDWPELTQLAAALLHERAPDLLIAATYALAQRRQRGLVGLDHGLDLLEHLLLHRWDELTPPRPRGRAAALAWYLAETARDLAAPPTIDQSAHNALRERIRALRDLSAQRLGAHAPAFSDLLRQLDNAAPPPTPSPSSSDPQTQHPEPATTAHSHPQTQHQPDPAPAHSTPQTHHPAPAHSPLQTPRDPEPAPSSPPAQTQEDSPPSAPIPPQLADTSDPKSTPERLLRGQAEALFSLAHQLRRRDLRDPRAYRTLRVGLWLHVIGPPTSRDGRTAIPPLPPPLLARLDDLVARASWPDLIEAIERAAPAHCFALTLHNRLAAALTAHGASQAAAAVQHEARALLLRLPELLGLHDQAGAPLLDPAARTWLTPPAPISARPHDSHESRAPHDPHDDLGQRSAFLHRLTRAESHLAADRHRQARLLLRGLEPLLLEFHLERWEPQLARRALIALIRAEAHEPPVHESHLIRLAALDPDALTALPPSLTG